MLADKDGVREPVIVASFIDVNKVRRSQESGTKN